MPRSQPRGQKRRCSGAQ